MRTIAISCALAAILGALFQPLRINAEERARERNPAGGNVEITIVVDNRASRRDLKTSWGFSCVIRGFEKTVLFDTGKDGSLLMHNLRSLHIAPEDIDVIVLSHAHRDHTGGLTAFLTENPRVKVYLLSSFPISLFQIVRRYGATTVPVEESAEICPDVYTTGAMGTDIEEQALVLRTGSGLSVVTGCAHPGIVSILKRVKKTFPSTKVRLVMGGFHLLNSKHVAGIARKIDAMGVDYVAPCHCSGMAAKRWFRRQFKKRFLDLSVGVTLVILEKRGAGRIGRKGDHFFKPVLSL